MTLGRPSFRQLEALVAALETGSVTGAAARMHISQPALSRLLSTLEADVGYPMFHRVGGRIVPTAEAELLREEIQTALAGVDRARRRTHQLRSLSHGGLSIAAFPSLAATTLPQLLSQFRAAHCDVQITLNGMGLHRLIEAVATRRADFAISGVPAHATGVVSEHLGRYHAVCVVRPDHPFAKASRVSLSAMAKQNFISLGEDDESQATISSAFREQGIEVASAIELSLCASACAWVATAGGCSIVDPFSAGEWRGQLVRVALDPPILFDLWLLRSEVKPLTRLASAFLILLQEQLRTLPGVLETGQAITLPSDP
jgi:DNA-binding transcriptional LysR family regulator